VEPTIDELRAVFLARDIADGEIGSCGLAATIPLAAMRLAQAMHAPNLTLAMEGAANPNPRYLFEVPVDPEAHREGEAILDLYDLFVAAERGIDFWFMSGIQIDRHGNLNVHKIGGTRERPAFRGPGIGATSIAMTAKRWYAYPNNHTARVFVEKVDFVTTLGSACRDNPGYGEGCRYVLSNLAILDFHEETGAMRLKHTMPGVSVEQVQEATGFELRLHDHVTEVPAPTDEELRLLREQIDPRGALRRSAA
jgi:glutaconate CoA-transferase subunit B